MSLSIKKTKQHLGHIIIYLPFPEYIPARIRSLQMWRLVLSMRLTTSIRLRTSQRCVREICVHYQSPNEPLNQSSARILAAHHTYGSSFWVHWRPMMGSVATLFPKLHDFQGLYYDDQRSVLKVVSPRSR